MEDMLEILLDISEVVTADGLNHSGLPGEGLHSEGVVEYLQHHHSAAGSPDVADLDNFLTLLGLLLLHSLVEVLERPGAGALPDIEHSSYEVSPESEICACENPGGGRLSADVTRANLVGRLLVTRGSSSK